MFTIHDDKTGERLSEQAWQRMTAARRHAVTMAVVDGRAMTIMAAGKVRLRIMPDGRCLPPGDADVAPRETCTRSETGPPCFCSPCRAARRA